MVQRDFIKRQFEELARALEKIISDILKLKLEGKINEAIEMSQETLKSTFDLNIEKILSSELNIFIESLIKEKKLSTVHLEGLGELLYATAEMFEQKKETEKAENLYQKVLVIFDYINQTEKTFSMERNNKIETIKFRKGLIN